MSLWQLAEKKKKFFLFELSIYFDSSNTLFMDLVIVVVNNYNTALLVY